MNESKLIIGLGNLLLKDEGVGVRCVEYLKSRGLGDRIKLVDGATLGFEFLEEIKGFEKVVLVDAADMGKEPGYIASFDAEQILSMPSSEKFSLHEIDLIDVIKVGKKIGYDFDKVRIVGIQPKEVSRGDSLSETIEEKLPTLAEKVLKEINNQKEGKMAVTPEILKRMDIFEFLTLEELKDIAKLAKVEEFEQGDLIFKEGDKAEKIYMPLEGRISIEIEIYPGKRIPVYTMTKGRLFGYPSLLRTRRFTTHARCLDKAKIVTIVADELVDKIFKKNRRRGYLVMMRVAELIALKLSDTRMQLLSLSQQ